MRNKPLLHPVVAALERQEAINRYLLEQINLLRGDMGYEPLNLDYVIGVVDGQGNGQFHNSSTAGNINSATVSSSEDTSKSHLPQKEHTPQPVDIHSLEKENVCDENLKGVKRYAETLEAVDGGLELGCDDYYLTDEENEYIFEVSGGKADFYLNPAKADSLLRRSQRSSWSNVANIESGPIPELMENQKYEIKIQSPGKASLIDGYWIIETPVSILISVK